MATANAVSLIASISAAANAEVAEKFRKGRPQRASFPIMQDVKKKEKKGSEKGKKKSVSHSPNTKDHDGKKTPAADELLTQFFENNISQSVFCPSVNVEKSRGDDDEVIITNELEVAARRLDENTNLTCLASNTELAAKVKEAQRKLEKMKKEWEEEERKAKEEERKAREEEEEEERKKEERI